METMTVYWQECSRSNPFLRWCELNSDLLNDPRLKINLGRNLYGFDTSIGVTGVYIIWAGVSNRTILKVGSGIIKDRFRAHLNDPEVQAYKYKGLYATWASILFVDKPLDKQRGVERFLGWLLNPKLGERFPANVEMVVVNPPEWDPPVHPLLSAMNRRKHIQSNSRNPCSVP